MGHEDPIAGQKLRVCYGVVAAMRLPDRALEAFPFQGRYSRGSQMRFLRTSADACGDIDRDRLQQTNRRLIALGFAKRLA